jgi:mono/diheme cytochrome c family protein
MMRRLLMVGAVAAVAMAARTPDVAATKESLGALQAPDGAQIYREHCKECHGAVGEPTKSAKAKYDSIPSFKTPGFFAHRSQDSIVTILKKGKGKDMKSWSEKLSDAEMAAVAQFVLTFAR